VLSNSVVSFDYDNIGLNFKGSEDKATNGIENSTTPQLIDAFSRVNNSEYPNKPYVVKNENTWYVVVADSMMVPLFVFTYRVGQKKLRQIFLAITLVNMTDFNYVFTVTF